MKYDFKSLPMLEEEREDRRAKRNYWIQTALIWLLVFALLCVLDTKAARACGDTSTQCIACDIQGTAL